MIGYLDGTIRAKSAGMVVVEVGGIGYEINLPGYVEYQLRGSQVGDQIKLHILYHHPEQATRPRLFGFRNQLEREFFEELTRVKNLGPTRALSIFTSPVGRMARAIVHGDVDTLVKIKGVGPQFAKKIVAELQQRAAKYALLPEDAEDVTPSSEDDAKAEVLGVLTTQLELSRTEAVAMIEAAYERNPSIETAEELFQEVYRGVRR